MRSKANTGLIALLLIVMACSSIDCPVQTKVATLYALYDTEGPDTLADTLTIWTARSDGSDTVLLNRGVGLTSFTLPISYAQPEDTLVFMRVGPESKWTLDTVWIKKDNIPHFESVDCSAAFFHRLTDVRCTRRGIDSVTINDRNVNYDATTVHFHIYFKNSL